MPTAIITGKDLALTINSKTYDEQVTSFTLSLENDQQEYDLINGATAYKTIKTTGTLDVEMLADWGPTGSLCEELWNAAKTAPDTGLAFTATANSGAVFTGSVFPVFPPAGGSGFDAQTVSLSMKVVSGSVTLA